MNPIFRAKRKDNTFHVFNKERFDTYLKTLPEDIEVIVRAYRNTRSLNQNRYYHGVVVKLIADHTGQPADDIHEILKARSVITKTCVSFKGKVYGITKSTTSLTTTEMEEYLSDCRKWAWDELEIAIPIPNEVDF